MYNINKMKDNRHMFYGFKNSKFYGNSGTSEPGAMLFIGSGACFVGGFRKKFKN